MTEAEQFVEVLQDGIRTDERDKSSIIQDLLKHNQNTEETKDIVENSMEFLITPEEQTFLENYEKDLKNQKEWAEKLNPSKTTPSKENHFFTLKSATENLRDEVKEAVSEDVELEKIAAAVEDSELAREADMEMYQLRRLRNRIESIIEKEEDVKEFLQKHKALEEKVGGMQNINQALNSRISVVEALKENAGKRSEDDKRISIPVPPWERERFDASHIQIDIENTKKANKYMEACMELINAADTKKEFKGDRDIKVNIKTGYLRQDGEDLIVKQKRYASTDVTNFDLMHEQTDTKIEVWMNAGFTFDPEGNNGEFNSNKRVIVVDDRLLDHKVKALGTILHELMHAYFEHLDDYTHLEIHEKALQVLASASAAMREEGAAELESGVTLSDVKKTYFYALASSELFPDT